MKTYIGLDIGGTKIAGAAFDGGGKELAQVVKNTPETYEAFLETCHVIIKGLENKAGKPESIGVGVCAPFDQKTGVIKTSANIPYLSNKPLCKDLEKNIGLKIVLGNDAACAALAEAVEGPGKDYSAVLCLILGTGVGCGYVVNGRTVGGANGLCGEVGHLQMPRERDEKREFRRCGCGGTDCIETYISGPALARLYKEQTGNEADAKQISALAQKGDAKALKVLDMYYALVARAMVVVLHSFDPDIIVVSGGLNALPGLYEEVTKRWGKYALAKTPKTKFVPASFGAMAGLRGAALLGKTS
ncbi:MAG: ROK family protein [Bdellovibrionales bacterium]